jgi:hypothetical protein
MITIIHLLSYGDIPIFYYYLNIEQFKTNYMTNNISLCNDVLNIISSFLLFEDKLNADKLKRKIKKKN